MEKTPSFSVSRFPSSYCQPVVSPEFPQNKGRNKTVFLDPFIFHYHNDLGFAESFHVYLTVCVCVCSTGCSGCFFCCTAALPTREPRG